MRFLTYFLLGLGALIAMAALAIVFLGSGEPDSVAPQTDTQISVSPDGESPSDLSQADDQSDKILATGDTAGAKDGDAGDSPAVPAVTSPTSDAPLSIDVARVKPDGQAVLAGTAAPGAVVTIFEGDILLGETVADANGDWVVILEKMLAPGQHLVSIATEGDGEAKQLADMMLVIDIAESKDEQPLVAVLPQTETQVPKLLQSPDDKSVDTAAVDNSSAENAEKTAASTTTPSSALSPQSMPEGPAVAPRALVWRDGDALAISGMSRGGVRVGAVVNGAAFAEALVKANGEWSVVGKLAPQTNRVALMFSLFDETGAVVATYDLPVTMRDLEIGLDGSKMVVVNKGDALWRIAYRSYGEGVRYVDIVRRNAANIDDPDMIYPNQIFALPKQ